MKRWVTWVTFYTSQFIESWNHLCGECFFSFPFTQGSVGSWLNSAAHGNGLIKGLICKVARLSYLFLVASSFLLLQDTSATTYRVKLPLQEEEKGCDTGTEQSPICDHIIFFQKKKLERDLPSQQECTRKMTGRIQQWGKKEHHLMSYFLTLHRRTWYPPSFLLRSNGPEHSTVLRHHHVYQQPYVSCTNSQWTHDSLPSSAVPVTFPSCHWWTLPFDSAWHSRQPANQRLQHPITSK